MEVEEMQGVNQYRLRLFVSGHTASSQRATDVLRRLCAAEWGGQAQLDVIDVQKDPQRASHEQIVLTPTLVVDSGRSMARLLGQLSDPQAVLKKLADHLASAGGPACSTLQEDLAHREVLDSQPYGIVVVDACGVLLFANGAAHQLFGVGVSGLVGTLFGCPANGHDPGPLELHRLAERRSIPLEMQFCPTQWEGRAAWTATLRDASGRKRGADTHQLLASVVASSDYAIISKTLDGTITSWNAGAQTIFGYTAEEAIGQSILMLFPADLVHEQNSIMELIARGERVHDFESLRVRRDGQRIHVLVSISPIVNDEGVVEGASKIASDISRRYAVNEQLGRNATLLRIASRAARLGGWTLEVPARVLVWSDEICRLHEVPLGATPGIDDAINYYVPEYRATVLEYVNQCLSTGAAFDFKAELLTARGRRLWVRAMGEAVLNDRGEIVGLQGAFQDISEQEAASEEIRTLGDRLVNTLESITDAFFTLDCAWRFSYVNREAERLLHHDRQELLGRSVWDAFPEAVGTSFDLNYRHAVSHHETVAFEEFYPQLGKWFDVRAYPSRDGLAIYFRDTTDWRRSQDDLRVSEERFQLLSKATNDAIWDWDMRTDSLWWNDGFMTLFGYAAVDADAGIEAWRSRIHPQDRGRVLAEVERSMQARGERWTSNYRFRRKDGGYAHVLDRGHVVRDSAGAVVRRVGGMTDISERVELEERLRQSQRMDAVGQLTGGVAHDFNNLLTVIIGNAELMVRHVEDHDDASALAEMILTAASRGAELTQRLLAFSRQQALDPKVVDVSIQLQELDKLLRRTLGEHIEIEYLRDRPLWNALVDPAQLENALLNLCLNARDAMPQGGRLIIEASNATIDANYAASRVEVAAGDYVMLAVSDTGVGISAEDLTKVFEPFYTTKAKGKGTGLGLAMVWGFVKQSGGHIGVYSELGQGTTVKLFLPRAEAMSPVHRARDVEGTVSGGHETILMVEDDAFVRRYAENQLRTLGYQVLTTESGQQALDLIRSSVHIDLLFTDVVMPGMGGRELVDRAHEVRPDLRVLYTSGYTENAVVHHGRLDPGVLLLGKPYRRADMARKVREALDGAPR